MLAKVYEWERFCDKIFGHFSFRKMKLGGLGEKIVRFVTYPYRKRSLSANREEIGAAVLRLLEEGRLSLETETMIREQIDRQRSETGEKITRTVSADHAAEAGANVAGAGSAGVEKSAKKEKVLTVRQKEELLSAVKDRFEYHGRFPKIKEKRQGIRWTQVQERLLANEAKLYSLYEMERTGGMPDLYGVDKNDGSLIFMDFCHECPQERRSTYYDEAARKAAAMGIRLLSEDEYRSLQRLGNFDQKSYCWLRTDFVEGMVGLYKRGYRDKKGDVLIYAAEYNPPDALMSFRGVLRV